MKIEIKLHPGSSQEKLEKISEGKFEVWIKEKPIDGKANESLVKFLKKQGMKTKIISGLTSRNKILELE